MNSITGLVFESQFGASPGISLVFLVLTLAALALFAARAGLFQRLARRCVSQVTKSVEKFRSSRFNREQHAHLRRDIVALQQEIHALERQLTVDQPREHAADFKIYREMLNRHAGTNHEMSDRTGA